MTAILVNYERIEVKRLIDYRKMYTILCTAIDEVIDPLERIPLAYAEAQKLRAALLAAEEVYIRTVPFAEEEEASQETPIRA